MSVLQDTIELNISERLLIKCARYMFFFAIWVFFHEHSRFTGQYRKGEEDYLFNSSLPLPPASQTLNH